MHNEMIHTRAERFSVSYKERKSEMLKNELREFVKKNTNIFYELGFSLNITNQ